MAFDPASLEALKGILTQVDRLISTTDPMPENRTPRCRELLSAAIALADDIRQQSGKSAAALLGSKGGSATAQAKGSEYFRELAARRKTKAGGRPKKEKPLTGGSVRGAD